MHGYYTISNIITILHVSMCLCVRMCWYTLKLTQAHHSFHNICLGKGEKNWVPLMVDIANSNIKAVWKKKGAIEKQYNGFSFWHLFDQLVFFSFYRHKKGLHKSWHQKGKGEWYIENLLTYQSVWQYSGNGNVIFSCG